MFTAPAARLRAFPDSITWRRSLGPWVTQDGGGGGMGAGSEPPAWSQLLPQPSGLIPHTLPGTEAPEGGEDWQGYLT